MRATTLMVRSFRNLAEAELTIPVEGLALVGPNGHGKTNLLEALAYPVLYRSIRGAADREIARFGGPGFHVAVGLADGGEIASTWTSATRRKRITVDGEEVAGRTVALGRWLAVAFLPTDLALVQGGAGERRRWLDRMLALASRPYLEALLRYRAALAQRNAALRRGDAGSVGAFDGVLARDGAAVITARQEWSKGASDPWMEELAALGETASAGLRYRTDEALADADEWPARLASSCEPRPGTRPEPCRTASRRRGAVARRPRAPGLRLDGPAAVGGDRAALPGTGDARSTARSPSRPAGR